VADRRAGDTAQGRSELSDSIAILGAGRLGESLLRGLLSSEWRAAADVVVTSRRGERLDELRDRYGVEGTSDNAAAVSGARLVVVAVKPQDMAVMLAEIAQALTSEQTLLSVAAGTTTAYIEGHLPEGSRVVRAMPNAPALVHEGIAGLCGGEHARDEDVQLAAEALGHLGAVVRVAEGDMDAVTALSGSGPAYFALLAEAMIEAGLLLGLSREVSTKLVVQTMFGSALLLRDEQMHPVELREAVTSPGGTTTRAIRELERSGVRAAFLNAITAATERSRELSNQ
jgi:pyrroline-5-carboxylate reductase